MGNHADDPVRFSIEANARAHDAGVSSETRAPKSLRQDDKVGGSASFSARNVRPTTGLTPSASNIPAVAHWRDTTSAPLEPLMTMLPGIGRTAPIATND